MRSAHVLQLALGILAAAVLAACGGSQPAPAKPMAECEFPDAPGSAAPTWVCSSSYAGFKYTAVGSGQSQNSTIARNMAEADARKQLASRMRQRVQRMVKDYTETTGTGKSETVDRVYTDVAKFLTDETLYGVRQLDMRVSPSRMVYVIVGMDNDDGVKMTQDALKSSYNNSKADWQRVMAKKNDDEMKAELDKMVQRDAEKN